MREIAMITMRKEEDLHPMYQGRTEYDRSDLICDRLIAWDSKVEWEIEKNTDFGKNIHDFDRGLFMMAGGFIKELQRRIVKLEVDLSNSKYRMEKHKKKVNKSLIQGMKKLAAKYYVDNLVDTIKEDKIDGKLLVNKN